MVHAKEKFLIVGIGEVLWDIYRDCRHLGGAAANFAIHAAQLGDHGVLVSRVGNDTAGQELLRMLRQRNLPVEYIQVDGKKNTGAVMVTVDVRGIPSFRCSRDVAFDYLEYSPELDSLAQRADAVFFGTLGLRSSVARQTILQFLHSSKRAVKIFDLNARAGALDLKQIVFPVLEMAEVLKVNRGDLALLQSALRRDDATSHKFIDFLMKKFHLKMVAVTHGEFGCELFAGNERIRVEGLPVRAIDTTGAGDAFVAGVIYKLLRGVPLRDIAEYANLIGAFLCTREGATPVFDWQDIEAFRDSL